MRHLPIALLLILYVLVIGQNWGIYSAAIMVHLYDRYDGRWNTIPFKVG